ncbi:MAG TPA: PAS domain S-box protein [Phycicoccus sp.]|nr:PAS domain S-box protein [Phycicoccus sp.]
MAHRGQPIVYVNNAFVEETGFAPDDVLGRSIEVLLPDPIDEEVRAWFTDVGASGAGSTRASSTRASSTREVRSVRADGSYRAPSTSLANTRALSASTRVTSTFWPRATIERTIPAICSAVFHCPRITSANPCLSAR